MSPADRTSPDSDSRQVAVTFDDLPAISVANGDLVARRRTTLGLLAALDVHRIPAVGFVNESMLLQQGVLDASQVALLDQWLDAGHELGNHTFSHLDLHRVPVEAYEADAARGDEVMRELLQRRGRTPRYFRHPYLHTGLDLATKHRVEGFLAQRGYRVAPVTIYTEDWMFSAAYDWALFQRRRDLARRVVRAYHAYLDHTVAYYESLSVQLFGRAIRQILLLHANRLNAVEFGAVAEGLAARGYEFVRLEQALLDPVYGSPDRYVRNHGVSWLLRWAVSRGLPERSLKRKPPIPAFVRIEAQTPWMVLTRSRIGRWRETLYARVKKPWIARLRGVR